MAWAQKRAQVRAQVRPMVGRRGGAFSPLSLFANGEDGFLFDFSKTGQLFQDTLGTVAVAADADPVGQALEGHAWAGKTLAQLVTAKPVVLTASDTRPDTTAGTTTNFAFGFKAYQITLTVTSGDIRWQMIGGSGLSLASPLPVGVYTSIVQTAGETGIRFRGGASGGAGGIAVKEIPGNHGFQATTTARPFWRTGGIKRPDGADDNHLTAALAGASGTSYVAKITVPASIAASQVLAGIQGAANGRFFVGVGTSGQIIGGVGTDSTGVVTQATDRRGTTGVIALVADGTNWRIYWNGAQVATGAQNGAVDTTVPFRLDALNNNGTAASFSASDKKLELAVNRAITATEVANLTTLWGTT